MAALPAIENFNVLKDGLPGHRAVLEWTMLLALVIVACFFAAMAMENLRAMAWLGAVGFGLKFAVLPFRNHYMTYDPFIAVPITPGVMVAATELV